MTSIFQKLLIALDFTNKKIKLDNKVEISKVDLNRYILRSRKNHYLQINEKEKFLVNLLKKEQTVDDLSYSFFMKYSQMALDHINRFVKLLYYNNFLIPEYSSFLQKVKINMQGKKSSLLRKIFYFENIDQGLAKVYKYVGFFLGNSFVNIFFILLILFSAAMARKVISFEGSSVFSINNSYILGLFSLLAIKVILTSIHEAAHGLSVKHFKRKIIKGGIVIHFGIPCFFVDTNDIWMRPALDRIIVTLAGIYSTLIIMALIIAGHLLFIGQSFLLHPFCLKIIFVGAISFLLNLNPLLYYDGYYALIDLTKAPLLRQRSIALFKKVFSHKGSAIPKKDWILLVYAFFSILWIVFSSGLVFYFLGEKTRNIIIEFYSSNSLLVQSAALLLLLLAILPVLVTLLIFTFNFIKKMFSYLKTTFIWKNYFLRTILFSSFMFLLSYLPSHDVIKYTIYLVSSLGIVYFFIKYLQLRRFWIFLSPFDIWPLTVMLLMFFLSIKAKLFVLILIIIPLLLIREFKRILVLFLMPSLFFFPFELHIKLLFTCFFFYQMTCWHKEQDLKINIEKELEPMVGDLAKIQHVYQLMILYLFKVIYRYYGSYLLIRLIIFLNMRGSGVFYEHSRVKYSNQLDDVYKLAVFLRLEFERVKRGLKLFWGEEVLTQNVNYVMDRTYWIYREVFQEYVLSDRKIVNLKNIIDDKILFLKGIKFFSNFTKKELTSLLSKLIKRPFKKGDILVREGKVEDEFFIIISGSAEVFREKKKLAILSSQDIFGERGLYLKKPRMATVIGGFSGHLFVLKGHDFDFLVKKMKGFEEKIKSYIEECFKFCDFLKTIPLFKNVSNDKLTSLSAKIKFEEFSKGKIIFNKGELGHNFYIIKEGKVQIYLPGPKKKTISLLSKGEFFGELALFKEIERMASAQTLENSILFVIPRSDFQSVFHDDKMLERISTRRMKENIESKGIA